MNLVGIFVWGSASYGHRVTDASETFGCRVNGREACPGTLDPKLQTLNLNIKPHEGMHFLRLVGRECNHFLVVGLTSGTWLTGFRVQGSYSYNV